MYLLDPMLATGGSAAMAIEGLQDLGARHVRLLCVVAAPEGVAWLETTSPEAEVYTAALDRELNAHKYILPGLGDFGDRLVRDIAVHGGSGATKSPQFKRSQKEPWALIPASPRCAG